MTSGSSTEERADQAHPVTVNVAAQAPESSNAAAVTSMVLGIVGAAIAFIPFVGVLGALLGGVAFIFGFVGVLKASKRGGKGKGQSIAGLVLGAVAIGIFMTLTMAIGGAITSAITDTKNDDIEEAASRAEKAATAEYGLNQPAKDGDLTFTVKSIKCGATTFGDGFDEVTADGQFCVLSLSVRNHSNELVSFDGSDQRLIDEAGRQYSPSIGFLDDFGFDTLNPGIETSGDIPFDVPAGVIPTAAELHDSFLSDGAVVRLK